VRHIGFWTPVPPQRTGIADYSDLLLPELARDWDISVVVDERVVRSAAAIEGRAWRPPDGVDLFDFREVHPGQFDFNVYQMGNNATFHAFMHRQVLSVPGLLVLHDPSLYDFYVAFCGGRRTRAFLDEAEYDLGAPMKSIPMIRVDKHSEVDRLALLLSRRVVETSRMTFVHSGWARDLLSEKVPFSAVRQVSLPSRILTRPDRLASHITFGIIGGINRHKRVMESLSAFEALHRSRPDARLLIAGRVDIRELVDEIERFIARSGLTQSVETRYDVTDDDLDQLLLRCDVLLALRWPTAGETSALVMRAFGAGIPVITSDVPQSREFDHAFCWRVSVDEALEHHELTGAMRWAAGDLDRTRQAGQAAKRWMESRSTYLKVAADYSEAISSCLAEEITHVAKAPSVPPNVNAIGCWTASTGLAEAARRSVRALSEAGVTVALSDYQVDVPKDPRRITADLVAMTRGRLGSIDLCFLNINEMQSVTDQYLRSDPARYLIAYWFWELPELPPQFQPEIRRFDEIWVASRFVEANFRPYTPAPIRVMLPAVEPQRPAIRTRGDFGIPETACVFLFSFDASSGVARKNPFGIIDAFKRAFADLANRSRVSLVMKTLNLGRWPESNFELRRKLADVDGIVIDEELSEAENSALTNMSDVYVSLHRAEGFGLGMAEAMYFGIPVIATRYSGSEEFLNASNSCGVGYKMKRVDFAELRYNPSSESLFSSEMMWADPDVAQAARWMRMLAEHGEMRERIGMAGEETIRHGFNAAASGAAMRRRLIEIVQAGSRESSRRWSACNRISTSRSSA
jgi:glycosyltransferase involved in cell wall biosynthesis